MGFGQYSPVAQARKSKADILAHVSEPVAKSRMIARNTVQYTTESGEVVTRLHGTDVVRRMPDGSIYLNTGGWNTATTRDRMNGELPAGYSVFTHRGSLYLHTGDGNRYEFVRQARIGPRGGVSTDIRNGDAAAYDTLRPCVDRYIAELRRRGVPTDTAGDPWVAPDPNSLKYDAWHVRAWIGDPATLAQSGDDPRDAAPYVFGTFVYHALRWSGLADYGVALHVREFNRRDAHMRRHVCRSVRRYIRACLGYASS